MQKTLPKMFLPVVLLSDILEGTFGRSNIASERRPGNRIMSLSLQWTGHALVDAGLATLTSFSGKSGPEELGGDDLKTFAEYAERAYFTPELASFLTVLFTSNFINPSFKEPQKRQRVKEVVHAYELSPSQTLAPCAFCHKPSVEKVSRDLLPMLTGRDTVNFYPEGDPGLPVCGHCIVAIQALTIGAPFISGRALVVGSPDKTLLLRLTSEWQRQARQRVELSAAAGQKLPPISRPLTRLIEALCLIDEARDDAESFDLDALVFSNSGQGPDVEIHHLPSVSARFLRRARAEKYRQTWNYLVSRSWQQAPKGKEERPEARRNVLYEDLILLLPSQAGRFLRRHILAHAVHAARRSEPEGGSPAFWIFTKLFASEFLNMDERQLERIRSLADALADSIASQNDRRLWQKAFQETNYTRVRNLLIAESRRRTGRGLPPLISFEDFVDLFEVIEGYGRPGVMGWRLTWDLILIRIIDQLHASGWLSAKPEEADQDLAGLERELGRDEEETEDSAWRS